MDFHVDVGCQRELSGCAYTYREDEDGDNDDGSDSVEDGDDHFSVFNRSYNWQRATLDDHKSNQIELTQSGWGKAIKASQALMPN